MVPYDNEFKYSEDLVHTEVLLPENAPKEYADPKVLWNAVEMAEKEYLTDENGERISLIDKYTGQQKVDKQNRRQWKCKSVPTNDWNSKENAKQWRKDFVETINAVNERMNMTDDFWEYRSFKEQGIELEPQIHLGEKASAMERAGIHTIRGDINRDIIIRNAILLKAQAEFEQAKIELEEIKAIPVKVVIAIKSEILESNNSKQKNIAVCIIL